MSLFPPLHLSVHRTLCDIRDDKSNNKYAAEEQVLRLLHDEELRQGHDILALSISVCYSHSKSNAGYSLKGQTSHLSRNQHEYDFFGRGAVAHTAGAHSTILNIDDIVDILRKSE